MDLAAQFTQFYYPTFAANRAGLAALYRDDSKLTWEGGQVVGQAAIVEKLTTLPFQKVEHKVLTTDMQPMENNNLIIVVTGLLVVDDSQNPLQFSQAFVLKQVEQSFYVQNDVFRLNYGS
ncbi:hypothetical protein AGABI1DRAFT_125583 [Agaricus bisporus var. burnettii JB137-S8]|uniref:Nuclear transport factor 2 n=2 Tax=Agaricus bisporus var. burnettii TaxID=192524 RepID=K5XI24_AGABU|nr:uncharacterized protein AGABI1DRAFT_125583 [Agaricus bisporus var. burnettii JB137-S8]EKM83103.1 hypothetical protein AGABI1DRAFT_125583 [Agaricus bisporus var. burnettii JB137-S8]KAF7777604.1 hypothetical protein Agabi119p4_3676 [Agaricus bisporus var. burnettii]